MRAKEIKRLVGALLTLCMLMTATPQIVLADTEYGDEARRNSEVIRLPLNIDIAESTEFQVAEQDGEIAQSSSDEAVTLANDTYSDWEEAEKPQSKARIIQSITMETIGYTQLKGWPK